MKTDCEIFNKINEQWSGTEYLIAGKKVTKEEYWDWFYSEFLGGDNKEGSTHEGEG